MLFLLSGCNLNGFASPAPTQDESQLITEAAATAFGKLTQVGKVSTDTPGPTITNTPLPPTLTPTSMPVITPAPMSAIGLENTQVHSLPGNGGGLSGVGLVQGRLVRVLARNISGQWLLINYVDSPTGSGWVNSNALKLNGDISHLAIGLFTEDGRLVFLAPPTWAISGVALPLPTISTDPALRPATVVQPANVRNCPTTSCMVIGVLKVGDQIVMTGRQGENKWAQFIYPSGPNGKGWISRDGIQPSGNGFGGLPYFDELGRLITPEPPTPTLDPNKSPTPSNTPIPTPAGPVAEISAVTTVYTLQSSLSPVLGTLNPKDQVTITAQSYNHLWFEIQYPAGAPGRAYISTKNVRPLQNLGDLPVTDPNGTPYPTP